MSPDDEDSNEVEPALELTIEPALESGANDGATRVDLGDDLLERTAVLIAPGTPAHNISPASPPGIDSAPLPFSDAAPPVLRSGPIAPEQIADHLQSARILMSEGMLEDAKQVLRRVLLADSSRVEARKLLEEIHELEIKQIFGEDSAAPRRGLREPRTEVEISVEAVLRDLDHDLGLGMLEEIGESAGAGGSARSLPSLFGDRAAMDAFGARMDHDFSESKPAERIDLGVAFLEMGLADLAVRHFKAAVDRLRLSATATDPLIAATGLLAYALLRGRQAFEATLALQPLLNDVGIERERKIDLIYLMGRALEASGKRVEARQWYAQASKLEPHYRDTDDRIERLGKARES